MDLSLTLVSVSDKHSLESEGVIAMRPVRWAIVLLTIAVSSVFGQQQRGIGVVVADPLTGEEVEMYQESWAILIGINRYKYVDMLDYAVSDADSMRSLLIRRFGFRPKKVMVLRDEEATKAKITEAFGTLLQTNPQDRVLVFYAGHGTQIDLPGGGEMGFIVPVDGKAGGPAELYSSAISMQEIRNLSSLIPAKHVLFLVDACYGGLAAMSSRSLSRETRQYLKKITVAKARQIITAGGRGEQVIEKPEWGHSAFTYKLLDALDNGLGDANGDYLITASELATWMKPMVSAASEGRQTPQFKAFTEDEGDFVFVLPEAFTQKPKVLALPEKERVPEVAKSKEEGEGEQRPALTKGKGSKTWLYVVGGIALAGGVAAAVLVGGGGGTSGTPTSTALTDQHPVLPP